MNALLLLALVGLDFNMLEPRLEHDMLASAEAPAPERARRVLFFTSAHCVPCRRFEEDVVPRLVEAGWKITAAPDAHVQRISAEARPDVLERYRVRSYPTFILIDGNTERRRHEGLLDAHGIAQLFTN